VLLVVHELGNIDWYFQDVQAIFEHQGGKRKVELGRTGQGRHAQAMAVALAKLMARAAPDPRDVDVDVSVSSPQISAHLAQHAF
jgi:hypothetical protein